MANRDLGQEAPNRFRQQTTDSATGQYVVFFTVNVNGVQHREEFRYEPWDEHDLPLINSLENAALDRLEKWVQEETNRQQEGALGLGYVGP